MLTRNGEAPPMRQVGDLRQKKKNNRWTSAGLLRLRKFYPTMTRERLAIEFAPHDNDAIKRMASRLKIKRRRKWQVIAEAYTPVIFAP